MDGEGHVSSAHGINSAVQLLKGVAVVPGGAVKAEAVGLIGVLHIAEQACMDRGRWGGAGRWAWQGREGTD